MTLSHAARVINHARTYGIDKIIPKNGRLWQRLGCSYQQSRVFSGLKYHEAASQKWESWLGCDGEKVLVGDKYGWDRKTKGQLAAEAAAKEDARERAVAGAPPPAASAGKGSWRDEKVLTYDGGWNHTTRGAAVNAEASKEYTRERSRIDAASSPTAIITSCDPGGCVDNSDLRFFARMAKSASAQEQL